MSRRGEPGQPLGSGRYVGLLKAARESGISAGTLKRRLQEHPEWTLAESVAAGAGKRPTPGAQRQAVERAGLDWIPTRRAASTGRRARLQRLARVLRWVRDGKVTAGSTSHAVVDLFVHAPRTLLEIRRLLGVERRRVDNVLSGLATRGLVRKVGLVPRQQGHDGPAMVALWGLGGGRRR